MAAQWNDVLGKQATALQELATSVETKDPALTEQAQTDFVDTQPYLQTFTDEIQTYK
jgi:hypothetical protein